MSNLLLITTLLGVLQGIFLSFVLIFKKRNQPANRYFGIFVGLFSLGLLEPVLEKQIPGLVLELALAILGTATLLYGPLIYFYVRNLAASVPLPARNFRKHALPFLLFISFDLAGLFFSRTLREIGRNEWLDLLAYEFLCFQILSYNLLSIRILNRQGRMMRLAWLRNLLALLTIMWACTFGFVHLNLFIGLPFSDFLAGLQVGMVLFIYLISYKAMVQPEVFERREKYEKSGLSNEQANRYLQRILDYISAEKPYLNSEMDIQQLATALQLTRNQVSQVINEQKGMNFQQLMNSYRVEEAKMLLRNPKYGHFTMLAIGLEAGFRSKTTFNENFKRLTGMTPSEWKNVEPV